MNKTYVILATLLVASLLPATTARHDEDCVPTANAVTWDSGANEIDPTLRLYVVNDFIPGSDDEFLLSTWVYQEGNLIEGLQRIDDFASGRGIAAENCGHGGDIIVF